MPQGKGYPLSLKGSPPEEEKNSALAPVKCISPFKRRPHERKRPPEGENGGVFDAPRR